MAMMNALELIISSIPSLSIKELDYLKEELRLLNTPCDKQGHKFKVYEKERRFLMRDVTHLFCERCGIVIKR